MNLKEHMKDFNRRWNITYESSFEEEFKKFHTRLIDIIYIEYGTFPTTIDDVLREDDKEKICRAIGVSRQKGITPLFENSYQPENIYFLLELITRREISFGVRENFSGVIFNKKIFAAKIKEAIDLSDLDITVFLNEEYELTIYPAGEEKFDEELVNETLSFLDAESDARFKEALHFYKDNQYIESAEKLRKTLETFLQVKLSNNKGLKENIKTNSKNNNTLGTILKQANSDKQIRNIIRQVFGYLDQYFNENTKHNSEDLDEAEIEYLIYQTGVLLRYIEKVM